MDITITGRNLALDDDIRNYIFKRLGNVEKLYKRIYKCEVVLDEEKTRKNVEIILFLKRTRVIAKESSPDMYASIDNASDKIKKQLRRIHGKVSSRRRKAIFGRFAAPISKFRWNDNISGVIQYENQIIKTNYFADKPMLPEEAMLELDLKGNDFIMFKNSDTGEANVLYKRSDGLHGLIEPKF